MMNYANIDNKETDIVVRTDSSKEETKLLMKKHLNFKCMCGRLHDKGLRIVMILPCEHMFHRPCLFKPGHKFCPICSTEIEGERYLTDKLNDKLDIQRYADILSVTNYCTLSTYSLPSVLDNMYDLGSTIMSIPFCKNLKDSRDVVDKFFSLNNTEIHIRGLERLDPREEKVFICNHTSYMDFMIITRFIDTYFLASDFINKTAIGRMLTNIVPIMIIKRGKTTNTVEEMRKFIEKNRSICLFPEGVMSHPDTILRFRTGAFHIGKKIYPIVLRYSDLQSDFDITKFLFKSSTRKKVKIYMDVIGPYNPPFTPESIEIIRSDMARVGDMLTSRVTSRGVTD